MALLLLLLLLVVVLLLLVVLVLVLLQRLVLHLLPPRCPRRRDRHDEDEHGRDQVRDQIKEPRVSGVPTPRGG
jgi:hypothetical protein